MPEQDRQQQLRGAVSHTRVEGVYPIQHGADKSRCSDAAEKANGKPDESWAKSIQQRTPQHLVPLGPKRDADADFDGALGDDVREHAEQTAAASISDNTANARSNVASKLASSADFPMI